MGDVRAASIVKSEVGETCVDSAQTVNDDAWRGERQTCGSREVREARDAKRAYSRTDFSPILSILRASAT